MNSENLLENMKILYVEDDLEAREELYDVLRRRAGKIRTADNGREGIEVYEEFLPHIVIADLYMPEMSGIEMIRQLREKGYEPLVVVISAVGDVDTILNAVDAGISKYIIKPINLRELLDTLNELAEEVSRKMKSSTSVFYTSDFRKQMEDGIKKSFAHFLKNRTGKGPRDVSVFINGKTIEIVASDVLTILEHNILDNSQNITIIKYIREQFFSVKEGELRQMILDITGHRNTLEQVQVMAEKDRIKLIFALE